MTKLCVKEGGGKVVCDKVVCVRKLCVKESV